MGLPGPCSGPFRTWPSAGTPATAGSSLGSAGTGISRRLTESTASRNSSRVTTPSSGSEPGSPILLYLEKEGFIGANGT